MTTPQRPQNSDPADRASRILQIVEDCMSRRAGGEDVSDEQVIDSYADLMPELRDELRKLALVERARARAAETARLPEGGSSELDDRFAEPLPDWFPGYDVVREVHRGGQGVVYQAIQKSTKRKVAIKVMREGPFAGPRDRSRFEREVQILGQLDHPGIVRIHDSGTAAGSFFYVMDYISGQALDAYTAGDGRSIDATLRLFVKVCEAVNAAHLRGVIHRDLKPSNIRVDSAGEPHVLDFGLAKLATQPLTEESQPRLISMTGQFIGSLPWASPEQAEGSPEKIDTRTDVYSLGVVLYQMLTGQFPYPVTGNMREVLDNILTVEPTRPRTVRTQIDDEVETLVLKCLRKERERRYQTAGELARDVRHYLASEPIEAKRDSGWYMLKKTLGRYKARSALAAAFLVVVVGALAVSATFWRQTALERDRARAAEQRAGLVADFLDRTLTSVDPDVARGASVAALREVLDETARRAAAELANEPAVQAAVRDALGRTYLNLGFLDEAAEHLTFALETRQRIFGEQHREVAASLNNMAALRLAKSEYDEAERLAREALGLRRRLLGNEHLEVAETLTLLGWICKEREAYDEAEGLYRQALAIRRKLLGEEHAEVAEVLNNLAQLYRAISDYEQAEALFRQTLTMRRELLGESHTDVATSMANLGSLLGDRGRFDQAEKLLRSALQMRRSLLGGEHPATFVSLNKLGLLLRETRNYAEAEKLFRQALELRRALLGEEHNDTAVSMHSLALVLREKGDPAAAELLFRQALAIWRRVRGEEHLHVASARHALAWTLRDQGQLAEAEEHCRRALAIRQSKLGHRHPRTAGSLDLLGRILVDTDRAAEAEQPLRDALDVLRDTLDEGHWRVARSQSALGACLTALDRFDEAEPLLLEGYTQIERACGPEDGRTREALQRVIELYEAWGKPEQADEYRALLSELPDASDAD